MARYVLPVLSLLAWATFALLVLQSSSHTAPVDASTYWWTQVLAMVAWGVTTLWMWPRRDAHAAD
jgi:hypothetical protein